jgi:soluble lytic murein transglycosylase-like protein
VAVAVLAVPAGLSDGARPLRPAEAGSAACRGPGCPGGTREARLAQIEDYLFARMPRAPQELHEGLARAIDAEAVAAGLDPLLVVAMIEVESGFDPSARSPAGAHGLMQLLPATQRSEMARMGLDEDAPADPVANVRAGVRYLRRCMDSYPGSLQLGLMAYNAGPNRVYGLLQDGGELPEWALAYPRRVQAELVRVRRSLSLEPGPRFAEARRPAQAE